MPGFMSGTDQALNSSCLTLVQPYLDPEQRAAQNMRVDANRKQRQKLPLGTGAPILEAVGAEAARPLGRILRKRFKHRLSSTTHKVSFNLETLRFLN